MKEFYHFLFESECPSYHFLKNDDSKEKGRQREKHQPCCSTYLCICWLILVRALSGDQTLNLAISGQCSNLLRYLARTISHFNIIMLQGCPLNVCLCNHNLYLTYQPEEEEKLAKSSTYVKKEQETLN